MSKKPISTNNELEQRIGQLKPGDHLCCIYETEEEHKAFLTPFIKQGLHRGEKVIYIVDDRTSEDILDYLHQDGQEIESFQKKGQFQILVADESYMREEIFDPDAMISFLEEETERALAEGFLALRVTGEMTWALRESPGTERLVEYETKLNDFFPHHKCLAICQYDKRRFAPDILLDVLTTHPIAIIGTKLYNNFYYIPPTELTGPDPEAARLKNRIHNLERHHLSEESLRQSEATTRSLLNIPTDLAVLVDTEGIILELNKTLERETGILREEAIGTPVWNIIPSEVRKERKTTLKEVVKTKKTIRHEDHIEGRWYDNVLSPVLDDHGKVQKIAILSRDISERKQMEIDLMAAHDEMERRVAERSAELRQTLMGLQDSERRLADAQQIARLGNWWWDLDKDEVQLSSGLYRIFGAEPNKIRPSKSTFLEHVHPDDRQRVEKSIEGILANNEPFALDHRILLPDGSVRFLHSVARLEHDTDNKPVRLFGIAQDITERKQTELELRIKEKAIASSISGIGIVDPQGKLTYVNDSLVKMWGFDSHDEILGRLLPEFWEGQGIFETFEALRAKGWHIGEDIGKRKDGTTFPVQFSASMIKDEKDDPLYMFGSFIDISEHKKVEEESRQLRAELTHLDRVVTMGALTSAIAHEVNQPLAAILSNAHAALRYLHPDQLNLEEVQEALKDIAADTKRAGEMIHRLRSLVVKEERPRETIDLNDVVVEVLQVVQSEALIQNAIITKDIDPELPAIYGDRIQLQQVILNLILNAIDAVSDHPSGKGHIMLSARAEEEGGVTVTVTDSGPGIASEKIEDIFKPFYSTKPQGMGLGLLLCRSILDAFGGHLQAANRPEGGAEVSFWLPLGK